MNNTVADSGGVLWVLKHPPFKYTNLYHCQMAIVYVATLRNKSNVYSLFGDTDLAQQCLFHTAVLQTFCF